MQVPVVIDLFRPLLPFVRDWSFEAHQVPLCDGRLVETHKVLTVLIEIPRHLRFSPQTAAHYLQDITVEVLTLDSIRAKCRITNRDLWEPLLAVLAGKEKAPPGSDALTLM